MPSIARAAALAGIALGSFAGALDAPRSAAAQDVVQAGAAGGLRQSAVAGQAIAVSRGGQRWGVGYAVGSDRWETLLRAAQQAMRECGRYDCRVQFQSVNPDDRCATFARGTRSYGLGIGPTPEAARGQALESCAMATTDCHITDSRCP